MAKKRSKQINIKPALKQGETAPLNRHWRGIFLDVLAETSNVTEAARRAEVSPSRAYKIRREEDRFARQWQQALAEGYDHLELETLLRLREGMAAGKDAPKFDIANALRLLAMHRETVARERSRRCRMTEAEVLDSIKAKIAAMRAREEAAAEAPASSGPKTSGPEKSGPETANTETADSPLSSDNQPGAHEK